MRGKKEKEEKTRAVPRARSQAAAASQPATRSSESKTCRRKKESKKARGKVDKQVNLSLRASQKRALARPS